MKLIKEAVVFLLLAIAILLFWGLAIAFVFVAALLTPVLILSAFFTFLAELVVHDDPDELCCSYDADTEPDDKIDDFEPDDDDQVDLFAIRLREVWTHILVVGGLTALMICFLEIVVGR